jgi:hypothetical protein
MRTISSGRLKMGVFCALYGLDIYPDFFTVMDEFMTVVTCRGASEAEAS